MMSRKILVIANETAAADELQAAIRGPAGGTQVLVVGADAGRLRTCITQLAARGIPAEAMIGDRDPVHATIAALQLFPADEIVISRPAGKRPNRLAEGLAEHFDGPILHVVVDVREPALRAA
jgi:hypothetical protein